MPFWGFAAAIGFAAASTLFAQDVAGVERLPTEWILKYEQTYGVAGLYVIEPPPASPADDAPRVRLELLDLTHAAQAYLEEFPDGEPSVSRLLAMGFIDTPVTPPEDSEYYWSEELERFMCTAGEPYDLVTGAINQLDAARNYRLRVIEGPEGLEKAWTDLLASDGVPETIKREIETRRYALGIVNDPGMKAAARTQELLADLNDAIEMAVALGHFEPGQPIAMNDVKATGLIELLRKLPLDGEYQVTKAGEPPSAIIRGIRVPYDPDYLEKRAAMLARQTLERTPDYPPALAIVARAQDDERAMATLGRAIDRWPNVPALRIQRLSTNARLFHIENLSDDIDYLLDLFPTAPICLEIDMATRVGALGENAAFRAQVTGTMAEIRPEVLNLQLLAYKALLDAGQIERAEEVHSRLVTRYPGYGAIIPSPSEAQSALQELQEQ